METIPSRRSFLKTGLLGAAAIAAAGTGYLVLHPTPAPAPYVFDDAAKGVLSAIIPVLLAGALPPGAEAIKQAIARTQTAVHSLPLPTQKEVADLLNLMQLGPARRLLTGIEQDWSAAGQDAIRDFLQAWRTHRSPTLQTGYLALHDLVLGPWYGDESTWERIGYPGPIKELR